MKNKWVNWGIWILVLAIATISSYGISQYISTRAALHAGWIDQTIISTHLHVGEPLRFNLKIYKHGEYMCKAFTVRVINNEKGTAIWNQTVRFPKDYFLEEQEHLLVIPINLPPGHYTYRADVHITCSIDGEGQFVTGTPLFDFIVEAE